MKICIEMIWKIRRVSMQDHKNGQGLKNIHEDNTLKDQKRKKLIVEVSNPKTDEEYKKMIDQVNNNFKLLYSSKN